MSRSVFVHWLPTMFSPEDLRGGFAVVIDVLRASTTLAQALSAGAEAVFPCGEVAEAQAIAANLPAGSFLLGGERSGVRIAGFDLGNSPLEYAPEIVQHKTIVFTTTNGTKALNRCRLAERIVIGCFANLAAVAQAVGGAKLPVHLVCAGTEGEMSAEDVLCAGALVSELQMLWGRKILTENDANRLAFELYFPRSRDESLLLAALRESRGGRNLLALGYDADIEWAAKRNRFNVVPAYHLDTGRIEVS
jgi:2-phosphosulfolactate phosphatase